MNAIILSSRGLKSVRNRRIVEELTKIGIETQIVNPRYCNIVYTPSETFVYYRNNKIEPQYVFPYYDSVYKDISYSILQAFQSNNKFKFLNDPESVKIAKNKSLTLQVLSNNNILFPNSLIRNPILKLPEIKSLLKCDDVLIKGVFGSQGKQVMYPVDQAHIDYVLKPSNEDHIIQSFVQESYGTDIRVFVIYGEIICSGKRTNTTDFRSNCSVGGEYEIIELDTVEKELVYRTVKAIGLNVCGVDMMRTNNGPMIIEVNSSPGLYLEIPSGLNLAEMIVQKFTERNKL